MPSALLREPNKRLLETGSRTMGIILNLNAGNNTGKCINVVDKLNYIPLPSSVQMIKLCEANTP